MASTTLDPQQKILQQGSQQPVAPAQLPVRPNAQTATQPEDLLNRFKRESKEVSGTLPDEAQTAKQIDNYARDLVHRAPTVVAMGRAVDPAQFIVTDARESAQNSPAVAEKKGPDRMALRPVRRWTDA